MMRIVRIMTIKMTVNMIPPGSYNSQEISTRPVMRMRISSSFKDDEDCEDIDNSDDS